ILYCLFFFSSRRRHTRFSRDWSSDVCSSDLEPFSQGAVADLIVVLQESDKGRWRLPGAWLAARLAFPRAIGLALIAEAFRQRPCQMANGIIREGGIVAGAFACGDAAGGMMIIVVPFGCD